MRHLKGTGEDGTDCISGRFERNGRQGLAAFATLDFPLTDVQVFHTDRGSGFDNTGIDEPLDVFGIKRSLSRKGNPYDNAVVESTDRLIDAKGYSDVDVYKRANINRKLFSKIRCGDGYMPSKKTVLALALLYG